MNEHKRAEYQFSTVFDLANLRLTHLKGCIILSTYQRNPSAGTAITVLLVKPTERAREEIKGQSGQGTDLYIQRFALW
jgi:hypothetical protein